jgi:aspartate-semialdehyde dehydrogenase
VQNLTIAVVGATGAVGTEFLRIIEGRYREVPRIKALASSRSAGRRLTVGGRELVVEETTERSFEGVDIAFISVSTEVSRRLAPIAVAAGAVVVDDSSAFRMEENVPLVVPEVNGQDVEWHRGIISIPNCSTTPLVMVCHPLRLENSIVRIIADTYQSVSGAGGAAMTELRQQNRELLEGEKKVQARALDHQIGFNVIPQVDRFLDDGYTAEERKMIQETRKIMHSPEVLISATCVRVPVFVSHSAAVHVEFERPMAPEEARELLSAAPGVTVLDEPDRGVYPMPWEVAGTDDVFVGRIRRDASHPNGLVMWVVADNLRKGAALNSIQIAEELEARHCLEPRRESGVAL